MLPPLMLDIPIRLARSGPGAGQFRSSPSDFIHFRRSEVHVTVYRQQTKNLLVSYSPKKLGFF
jgi:hypothetical protein